MTFNKDKFKWLVHYIVWRAGDDDGFGATKLNKVLWFSDARTHTLTGEPITGATYIREKYGPVPRQMMPVQKELEREGTIKITRPSRDYEHTRFKALIPPIAGQLTSSEFQTVNYWIDHISKAHTARSISDETHEDYSWQIAEMGEELPLNAIRLARIEEPSGEELERLRKRAKELGLH